MLGFREWRKGRIFLREVKVEVGVDVEMEVDLGIGGEWMEARTGKERVKAARATENGVRSEWRIKAAENGGAMSSVRRKAE